MRLFLFVIVFCLQSIHIFAQAKIEVDDTKKSFGFVKKGEVVKLQYNIKNIGTEPLIINEVEIGCSCTTVDYPKQPIPPQKEEKITIIFDTKTVYDRQDRVVILKTNDSKKSTIKLRYKGVVLIK